MPAKRFVSQFCATKLTLVIICDLSVSVQLTVRDALNSALDEELARDDRVFIMGEEVTFGIAWPSHGTMSCFCPKVIFLTWVMQCRLVSIKEHTRYAL